jgi:hypothetical protein
MGLIQSQPLLQPNVPKNKESFGTFMRNYITTREEGILVRLVKTI